METDGVPDFRSRRAMFQQMSNSSNMPQPTSSHQGAGLKGHRMLAVGESNWKTLENGRVTLSEESNTAGKHALLTKPCALPRVKFNSVLKENNIEEPKVSILHASTHESVSSLVNSRNHVQTHTVAKLQETDSKDLESTMDKNHFRNTLLIWENASFQDTQSTDLKRDSTITRTTTAKDDIRSNGVFEHNTNLSLEKSNQEKDVSYQKGQELLKGLHPQCSNNESESTEQNIEHTTVTQEIRLSEYPKENERISDSRENCIPTIKPLPSIEDLGPPPKKPERPPVVDLRPFLCSTPVENEAVEDYCPTPEINESSEEPETYEDVLNLREGLNSRSVYSDTENDHGGYVYLTKEGEVVSPNHMSHEVIEDLYYDVQGLEGELNQMESSTFTSDSFSENSGEVYDYVHNFNKEDTSSTKSDREVKLKGIGRIFKRNKEKSFPKIPKPKENGIFKSTSVPNLTEDADLDNSDVYNDVDNGMKPNVLRRGDKPKKLLPNFLLNKEGKEKRKSLPWVERTLLKNKGKKIAKEEKLFREKFEYTKEIEVINTAVVDCSANITKAGKQDLPITPGEELDIIDITDENRVICRNAGSKYGYVLVEHLTFKN